MKNFNTNPFLMYHILLWGYSNTCRFTRAPSLPPIVLPQESPPFPANQRRPLIHSDLSWTMLLSTFLPPSIPRPPSTSSAQPAWGCYLQRTRRGSLLSCIGPSRIPTPSTFPRMVSMWFQANLKVGVPFNNWSSNSLVLPPLATHSQALPCAPLVLPPLAMFPGSPCVPLVLPPLATHSQALPVSHWFYHHYPHSQALPVSHWLPRFAMFPGSPFQSSRRNSIFGVFVNPIIQKAAPLIIFEWIQFSGWTVDTTDSEIIGEWVCFVHQEAFLSKQCVWSQ